ncbi:type II toxin-antitoxin system PemK/MazF family toxin [Micrococcus luteus]|uniref:type II toxin-antitoxin system PemK/MazF family toxin n=1 Tax=Micrococcus luteus TaxID=1270 RepID=UPI00214D4B41|nr:type II toxin-antitoxin system PemK/MazF family toxin [Micrococcus luteus]
MSRTPRPGDIFYVTDVSLSLPPEDDREVHASRRPCLILSCEEKNSQPGWPILLIAPISSSTNRRTQYCVKLGAGEANLPRKCWVRVPAVQPLAKDDISDYLGSISQARLEEVQAGLMMYMGIDLASTEEELGSAGITFDPSL